MTSALIRPSAQAAEASVSGDIETLEVDVAVVGAGPSGLTAALALAKRQVRVAIVDPCLEPNNASPRCKQLNPRTMEHFRRLQVSELVRSSAPLPRGWSDSIVFCTGLRGELVSRFDGVFSLADVPTQEFPEPGLWTAQYHTEAALRAALVAERSVSALWGETVSGIREADDGVIVSLEGAPVKREIRAKYVIGADGGRSTVRKELGIALSGESNDMQNLQIIFRAPELTVDESLGRAVQYWVFHERGHGILGQLDDNGLWWAILLDTKPEITAEGLAADLEGMTNLPREQIDVIEWNIWNPRMLLADRFQQGRCFLIGDAAHLNPPFGGLGANTGIGDAVDIAWKLAAKLEGWGGDALLESYELERRPIAHAVIAEARANMEVLTLDLETEGIRAAAESGARVRERASARIIAAKPREFYTADFILGQRYGESPVLCGESGSAVRQSSGLVGARLPHRWIAPGVSLYDLLGKGFTWIDVVGDASSTAVHLIAEAEARSIPLEIVTLHRPDLRAFFGGRQLIVRPDHVIAWAGGSLDSLEAGQVLDRIRGVLPNRAVEEP